MWLFCLLDQDKFHIVQFIPTQVEFLATPLVKTCTQDSIGLIYCIVWNV